MSRVVQPVPLVTEADVAQIPQPVTACASCGFLGVVPPSWRHGGVPGANALMTERFCPRCSHRGPPLEFELRADYVEFVRALQESPSIRE